MHSLNYERNIANRHYLLTDDADIWRAKAIEAGKLLSERIGKEKYDELIDNMPGGSWRYYYIVLRAELEDLDVSYGTRERDWIGIQ